MPTDRPAPCVLLRYADADDWYQLALIALAVALLARQIYKVCKSECCCCADEADRHAEQRRRARRDAARSRGRRTVAPRRAEAYSDDDDDDDELLVEFGDELTSPRSNMPLRSKRSNRRMAL